MKGVVVLVGWFQSAGVQNAGWCESVLYLNPSASYHSSTSTYTWHLHHSRPFTPLKPHFFFFFSVPVPSHQDEGMKWYTPRTVAKKKTKKTLRQKRGRSQQTKHIYQISISISIDPFFFLSPENLTGASALFDTWSPGIFTTFFVIIKSEKKKWKKRKIREDNIVIEISPRSQKISQSR